VTEVETHTVTNSKGKTTVVTSTVVTIVPETTVVTVPGTIEPVTETITTEVP
jgi:hypothetical protein